MSHFSFKKKCLWFMFAVLPFVSACQSNSSGSEPRDLTLTPPAPDAPTDTNPVKPANPENPVEAQRWCRVEDWGKFQVVMRAVAGSGQMQLQYLRITPNAPTIHPVSEVYPYEMRGPVSFPEKKKWVVTYWTDTTKIKGLYGYDKQKEIVEKKLVNNPALFQERSQFAPEKAITVVTRSLSDEDEVIRQFYPCEQYSPYFSRDGAVRSSIEMALYLAWSNKGFVGDENQRSLADSMKLNLPVEEVKLDVGQLDRSQWCSWHQIQPGVLLLRTLTFNGGQYLSNIHTQHFTEVGSEADTMAYLTNNARYSVLYNLSRPQGRIAGKKEGSGDRKEYLNEELFSAVRDANGTTALVRMNEKDPDDTWPAIVDIYYDCKDSRPLAFSPAFGQWISTILDLQFKRFGHTEPPERPVTSPEPIPEVPHPEEQPESDPQPSRISLNTVP